MAVILDDHVVTLTCDTCGDTVAGPRVPSDTEVVWPLVSEHGWSGSPLADGPHRCAHCTRLGPAGVPGGILGIEHLGDVTVVTVAGDVDLDTGDTLRMALRHAAEMGGHVLVDLDRTDLLDSTALGLLVRAHRGAVERGALLCVAAASPLIRQVLQVTRLDELFPVAVSRADALARLDGRPAGAAPQGSRD
ncbi:STAS domain-containing protein [Micromonospora sp. WMMD1082]|uniref:STAS domain-containing protein n=1 Tax=Micromonospora sp. WMMD1082 TaxID=3016104 RepID=UPI002415FC72|nr:STAS domain-containing protein [Micromonospora sp. WMMD1082]MDG4798085.1 STAS domain-containing protein [Micromonospora sp. WMMD1082]